jgi:phosphatidylglycerophosphate synthase
MEVPMEHQREHRSLLAHTERNLLIWLARRLPARVSSDHLTLIGLAAIVSAGLAFAAIRQSPWSVMIFVLALVVNWFGDSLDGTLARVRARQRPRYGFYVDHVVDLVGTTSLVAGIALSGLMHPVIALAALAGYLLVSAESYLATHSVGIFRISFGGIGPTELRILLALGAVFVPKEPGALDVAGVVAAGGLVLAFLVSAIRNTRELYRAEPLPPRRTEKAA